MIKGLAITTPTIGRITIGSMAEINGRLLPVMEDYFTITKQSQTNSNWDIHPLHAECLSMQNERFCRAKKESLSHRGADEKHIQEEGARLEANNRLREIPVKLLYNDPALSFSSEFTAFDPDGRPVCAGNGQDYVRRSGCQRESGKCPTPDFCTFGQQHYCKPYGRLNVQVEGQHDELGVFLMRTAGWNTIRTLTARINALHALTGGRIAGLPLALKINTKSTTQSFNRPVTFVDLRIQDGLTLVEAIQKQAERNRDWAEAGVNRDAFEECARAGLANGYFKDTEEDGMLIVQEFYPEQNQNNATTGAGDQGDTANTPVPGQQQTPLISGERQPPAVQQLLNDLDRSEHLETAAMSGEDAKANVDLTPAN